MEGKNKYLFIGGSGHSGTSMLFKIFSNNAYSIRPNGESRIIESLSIIKEEYNKISDSVLRYQYLTHLLFYGYKFKKNKFDVETKKKNHFINPTFNFSLLTGVFSKDIKIVIDDSLVFEDRSVFVEKTPSNVFHIKDILKLVDQAKIIIIHRDVRDVVASLKKRYAILKSNPEIYKSNVKAKKLDKDYNLIIDSIAWNKAVKASKVADSHVRIIRYEDFVSNSNKELKNLCEWGEIKFDAEMLNTKKRNSSDLNIANSNGVSAASVGSKNKVFSKKERYIIQKYSKEGLISLGYPLEDFNIAIKAASLPIEFIEFTKVFGRIFKRLLLMNPKYATNFAKRFLNKMKI